MMRFISVIVVFALFLAFIVLNMPNRCNISFGFKVVEDVPVFISVLFSFMLGMLFALPFGFSLSRRLKKTSHSKQTSTSTSASSAELPGKKKLWGKGKDKSKGKVIVDDTPSVAEEISDENNPYGID